MKDVFHESYLMAGVPKPWFYPITELQWVTPNPNHPKLGKNRHNYFLTIVKTCISFGGHDVRIPGFVYLSSCRCLQPMMTPYWTSSAGRLHERCGAVDPGTLLTFQVEVV